MSRKKVKLVCGWGVNDVNYSTQQYETINGKLKLSKICPYYRYWKDMIRRVHDRTYQNLYITYTGCTVCEDWKYLSNFVKWVDSQPNKDWQNCQLDKDLLIEGNKHYGAETCVFVLKSLNIFVLDSGKNRGKFMIGVVYTPHDSCKNPYTAYCNDPFKINSRRLGVFSTELEAHLAWKAKKYEYACMLADMQDDPRVADALRQRYAPDKDWTNK